MMKSLLKKLNYKGQKRISVINADDKFIKSITLELNDVIIDQKIDPRYPYEFVIIFVKSVSDIEAVAPLTFHNLMADGILWFCYPKRSSKKYSSDIDRDHGWKTLNASEFHGVRLVAIDEDWSALRFRNIKYIKTSSERFKKQDI
jgi:hypothetical protein